MTIRYLLVVVTVVSICISILCVPYPSSTATIVESNAASVPAQNHPFTFKHFLWLWPVRLLAVVGSVTLTVHTIARLIGLGDVQRWLFAIVGPTIALIVWHWFSIHILNNDPQWFSTWDLIEIGIVVNSGCYIVLCLVLSVPRLFQSPGVDRSGDSG